MNRRKLIRIVDLLRSSGRTLASCESLTGGLFASSIASCSGVSAFFKGAICSYATSVKEELLGISSELIGKHGVVSEEVALEMALRGAKLLDAELCVSFTGNAGPEAMEGKPVGLVYIGIWFLGRTEVRKFRFEGDRNRIREHCVDAGLSFIEEVLGKMSGKD